jgi:phosphatidylserine/phosphatidylglycerophosphate/cardiolipin synthase-like enzyme
VVGVLTITSQFTPHISAFFNKGVIAAQWVERAVREEHRPHQADKPESEAQMLRELIAVVGGRLRDALGGLLKRQILSLLDSGQGSMYAALYALSDPELVTALKKLGQRANLVLANGAVAPDDPDENAEVREDLKAHSAVHVFDRMVSSGHFAHNKFVVFCDSAGDPQTVLTGSTNWTKSGLCTQANNALVISDAGIAARFSTSGTPSKTPATRSPRNWWLPTRSSSRSSSMA